MMVKTITGMPKGRKETGWPIDVTTRAKRRGGFSITGTESQGQDATTTYTPTKIKRGSP